MRINEHSDPQPPTLVRNIAQTQSNQIAVIDFAQYWNALIVHKWRIMMLTIATTLLVAVYVSSLTPIYRTAATLMIETQKAKVSSVEEIYGLNSANKEYFLTQFEVLKSRSIAERLVNSLDLMSQPEYRPPLPIEKSEKFSLRDYLPFLPKVSEPTAEELANAHRQNVINKVAGRISVEPVRNTQLVKIGFESKDPQLAALVANTIPAVYINSHLESKTDMTDKATSWLSERRVALRETLDASEQKLHKFKEQNSLVDVKGVEGLASQELNQLTSQLSVARRDLGQVDSIYKVIKQHSAENLETLPEVLNHSVILDIHRVEEATQRRVSELGHRYGPKHPKMIAIKAELASVQENKRKQIRTLVTGIANEYKAAVNNVSSLERELVVTKQAFQKISRKASVAMELQREVDINQELYSSFLKRFTETAETGNFAQANARVTDEAVVPLSASKPNKKMLILIAFVASTMFGVMLAFLYEALHDGIRSVSDVEDKLSMRLLGLLPIVPNKNKAERLNSYVYFNKGQRAFQESVRSLRTSLILSNLESKAKVITITSTHPSEGKSTVASSLAFALGQMENVLLIDGDLRKPSLGGMFNLSSYHPGLTNLIAGTNLAKECIVSDANGGVDFMPAGALSPNPQELLGSKRFENVIDVLSQKYDRIIIDTAPTMAVSDALILSKHSDSMLYVVKADSTPIKAIQRGLEGLFQVGARVDGVVLNSVDVTKSDSYGTYYSYGYGDEHAEEASQNTGLQSPKVA